MLNQVLYKGLEAAFGSVIVEKENDTADIIRDPASIYSTAWRIDAGGGSGEEYRVNCPFCGDRNHHLYISYLSYSRPVVNGVTMAVGGLLAHCFRRNCIGKRDNFQRLGEMIRMGMCVAGDCDAVATVNMDAPQIDQQEFRTSDAPTVDGIRTWVSTYVPCTEYMPSDVSEYLYGRGLTDETLKTFNVGWGQVVTPRTGRILSDGNPMIVLPVVMNGRLHGVQARCLDKYLTENGLRYWIHPGMRKRNVVYNLDAAARIGCGVLCEGVFDVLKVGRPGVCLFGHTPSKTQLMLLQEIRDCMILLPDTDEHEAFSTIDEARELAETWNAANMFRLGAHVVVLPEKDAGCMDRQSIWETIVSQVPDTIQGYLADNVIGFV